MEVYILQKGGATVPMAIAGRIARAVIRIHNGRVFAEENRMGLKGIYMRPWAVSEEQSKGLVDYQPAVIQILDEQDQFCHIISSL